VLTPVSLAAGRCAQRAQSEAMSASAPIDRVRACGAARGVARDAGALEASESRATGFNARSIGRESS
jgi:hypothetical protein